MQVKGVFIDKDCVAQLNVMSTYRRRLCTGSPAQCTGYLQKNTSLSSHTYVMVLGKVCSSFYTDPCASVDIIFASGD